MRCVSDYLFGDPHFGNVAAATSTGSLTEKRWAAHPSLAQEITLITAPDGTATFSFNTQDLYRGRATRAGEKYVAIYGAE